MTTPIAKLAGRKAIRILKRYLTADQRDVIAAAIAYDTVNLHDAVSQSTSNRNWQDECEKAFQGQPATAPKLPPG